MQKLRFLIAMLLVVLYGTSARAQSVLVFGGAGQLGAEVVRELTAHHFSVTVLVRPSSNRARLAGLPVSFVVGDVLHEGDVERVLRSGTFKVVVDALGRSGANVDFYATAGRSIAYWSKVTGVQHIILHGSVGVGESRVAYPVSNYAVYKTLLQAKEAAEQALRQSGVPFTIIRNAVLHELNPGQMDLAHRVSDPSAWGVVSRRGLARLTRECINNSACQNKTFTAIDPGMR